MAKTQVTDATASVSGILALRNQYDAGTAMDAFTHSIDVLAGGVQCMILDVTSGYTGSDPQPDPPPGTVLTFLCTMFGDAPPTIDEQHEFLYVGGANPSAEVSASYSYSISGQRLLRTESTTAWGTRSGAPVHAREVTYTDEWSAFRPATYTITFGNLSVSGTQVDVGGAYEPVIDPITGVTLTFVPDHVTEGVEHASISLNWSGVPVNFSGRSTTQGSAKLTGSGNAVRLSGVTTGHPDEITMAVTHARPRIYDFSQFRVRDREGNDCDNLRVAGGFTATPLVSDSLTWSTTQ